MPNVSGRIPVDVKDLDQDFDSDLKKVCTLMWSLSLYIVNQWKKFIGIFLFELHLLLLLFSKFYIIYKNIKKPEMP